MTPLARFSLTAALRASDFLRHANRVSRIAYATATAVFDVTAPCAPTLVTKIADLFVGIMFRIERVKEWRQVREGVNEYDYLQPGPKRNTSPINI